MSSERNIPDVTSEVDGDAWVSEIKSRIQAQFAQSWKNTSVRLVICVFKWSTYKIGYLCEIPVSRLCGPGEFTAVTYVNPHVLWNPCQHTLQFILPVDTQAKLITARFYTPRQVGVH